MRAPGAQGSDLEYPAEAPRPGGMSMPPPGPIARGPVAAVVRAAPVPAVVRPRHPIRDDQAPLTALGMARADPRRPNQPSFAAWGPDWQLQGIHLGSGGFGTAFLYLRVVDGLIKDRVVVKDTFMPPLLWSQSHRWYDDVTNVVDRVPVEVHCVSTAPSVLTIGVFTNCICALDEIHQRAAGLR